MSVCGVMDACSVPKGTLLCGGRRGCCDVMSVTDVGVAAIPRNKGQSLRKKIPSDHEFISIH